MTSCTCDGYLQLSHCKSRMRQPIQAGRPHFYIHANLVHILLSIIFTPLRL
jgi:hypothetical protein